jgi:hypothetical protein
MSYHRPTSIITPLSSGSRGTSASSDGGTQAGTTYGSINAQGQTAPAGFHYMPDGTLMSDIEHASLYAPKTILGISMSFNDVKQAGENRRFIVLGDNGAIFSLEITNEDNYYYNFQTNLFQAAKTKLHNVAISNGRYVGNIKFPLVTDADQYDIYLTAENGSKHAAFKEIRLADGSFDTNSSTGSNSLVLQKVIYQLLDVTITLAGYSPNATVTGTIGTQTFTAPRGQSSFKIPISFIFTATSTRTLSINKQPTPSDIHAISSVTVGAAPVGIPGENIYPTVKSADKVVNGAVSSGTNVTMDDDVGSAPNDLWAVGDKITGNAAFDARTNATAITVTAVNVGSNAKVFTMSEAIAIDDDEELSFSNQRNYRWPVSNIDSLRIGMQAFANPNFAGSTTIKRYLDEIVVFENELQEQRFVNVEVPALDTLGAKPTITRNASTKVVTTTQTGNITFADQALFALAGTSLKIFSYDVDRINYSTGYNVSFSDLAVALTEVSTTTTAAVNSSTSVVVAERAGIMDAISSVTGIGINSNVANPTVASGAGSVTGAGTIVLSAAQTLENGVTLTFPGAGTIATITGYITVNNVGNEDVRLRFDLEKLLTMH